MKRLGFKKSIDLSGIDERIGTSEGKIATLERTTSDINQALATTQNQMNAKFDNLTVGGRNLILASQVSRTTQGTTALSISQNIDYNNLTNLVLSVDVAYKNARKADKQGAKWFRIGAEFRFIYTDNTVKYYGAWAVIQDLSPTTFNGRITNHISVPTDKTIKMIDLAQIQIWDIVADEMLVKNPKLEIGTIATDWTPAPEDYTAGLTIYNTTTAQSPNVFISDTGQLQRSTSSERYKEIISPLVLDDKAYKNAMKLNPIIYRSTAEADKQDWHYYSFSAEQLGQFDKAFTLWRTPTETIIDDNGEITITELEPIAEGINLNAIVAFLHATNVRQGMLIRDLTKRIEFLENQRDK